MKRMISGWMSVVILCALCVANAAAQESPAAKLDKAVATFRHVDQKAIAKELIHAKAMELQGAWESIVSDKTAGRARLKEELKKLEEARERDDFFKLASAAMLWEMGGLDESATVAGIWDSTPVHVQYMYSFHTAFDAARTHDARALPMLLAISKDRQGELFIPMHSWNIGWPLTHEFVWGLYGPGGHAALREALTSSKSEPQLETAILLLARSQDIETLRKIRALAKTRRGDVRAWALRGLAYYGHPNDYAVLVAALSSKDGKEVAGAAGALGYYGDQRAVPLLIPLLKSKDGGICDEAGRSLYDLLTPEALDALRDYYTGLKEEHGGLAELNAVLRQVKTDWAAWEKASDAEKREIVRKVRQLDGPDLTLAPQDRRLTREEFQKALAEWKKNGRLGGGSFEWVELKHVVNVATPDDIPAMLETRATFYGRLSDECMHDVREFDHALQFIGRSRYRKDPGVCAKVEAK